MSTHTPRISRTLPIVLGLASIAGCGHVRIDQPALVNPAEAVGESSAALMTRDVGAPEQLLAADLTAVGAALVDLSLAHDDWAVTTVGAVPEVPAPALGPPGVTWDGTHLDATLDLDDGTVLVADLRFHGGGTQHVDSVPGGTCITGESVEVDQIQCPPFIDQTVVLERSVLLDDGPADLRLVAEYGLALNGDGRPVGGEVDVHYVLTPTSDAARGGFVAATFHGLGRIQVFTRQ